MGMNRKRNRENIEKKEQGKAERIILFKNPRLTSRVLVIPFMPKQQTPFLKIILVGF